MKKALLFLIASGLLLTACNSGEKKPDPKPGPDPTPVDPTPGGDGEELVVNGDLEVFRQQISADEEVAIRELGQNWATDYGLGTYTGNGETVAKVTKVDGDPCMKLDGRGGSSNVWIWAGGSEADTYMYHPLGASPAGEYLIDVDLKYDVDVRVNKNADPTLDALATEFLGGPAQSMIQFTEYAEFEALPASTVRGEGWKHAQFKLNKMADKDGNGWFNLYCIPGENGGVLYMDNVTIRLNEEGYDFSYLVDINDGDKGQFTSYYKRMLTNDYAENNGYYTIGSEDAKGKVVIDGTVCAMKLSYEGHGETASFAKNVNLSTAKGKKVAVEFDAKFVNAADGDVKVRLAGQEKALDSVTVKESEGTASEIAGFKHFALEMQLGEDALNRLDFTFNTHKDILKSFEVTNLSIKVK